MAGEKHGREPSIHPSISMHATDTTVYLGPVKATGTDLRPTASTLRPGPATALCLGLLVAALAGFGFGLGLGPGVLAAESLGTGAWPMYRGTPSLIGLAAGTVPEGAHVRWTFKAGGPVKSSAAVVDGRVFVGCDDGQLYALGAADGRRLWACKTGDSVESSPLVLQGTVYVGSNDNCLYALDAAQGKLRWKYETGGKIPGAANWVKAPGGGGTWILVGSYDFKLHCVDSATGRSNWVYESANYINGAPAVAEGRTVFGGCDAILHVISLADGKQVKEVEAGA